MTSRPARGAMPGVPRSKPAETSAEDDPFTGPIPGPVSKAVKKSAKGQQEGRQRRGRRGEEAGRRSAGTCCQAPPRPGRLPPLKRSQQRRRMRTIRFRTDRFGSDLRGQSPIRSCCFCSIGTKAPRSPQLDPYRRWPRRWWCSRPFRTAGGSPTVGAPPSRSRTVPDRTC